MRMKICGEKPTFSMVARKKLSLTTRELMSHRYCQRQFSNVLKELTWPYILKASGAFLSCPSWGPRLTVTSLRNVISPINLLCIYLYCVYGCAYVCIKLTIFIRKSLSRRARPAFALLSQNLAESIIVCRKSWKTKQQNATHQHFCCTGFFSVLLYQYSSKVKGSYSFARFLFKVHF